MANNVKQQWEWILINCTGKKIEEVDFSELDFEEKAWILAKLELEANHK